MGNTFGGKIRTWVVRICISRPNIFLTSRLEIPKIPSPAQKLTKRYKHLCTSASIFFPRKVRYSKLLGQWYRSQLNPQQRLFADAGIQSRGHSPVTHCLQGNHESWHESKHCLNLLIYDFRGNVNNDTQRVGHHKLTLQMASTKQQ